MKKYISLVVLALLLVSFGKALAEGNETENSMRLGQNLATRQEAFRENLQMNREAFLKDLKTKKEEFRKATLEKKEEFRGKAKRMIGERFEAAVKNLERIQGKIGDLLVKLDDEDKDTTAAAEFLDASKQKLSEAKAKIEAVKKLIPTEVGKVTPEIFEQIKTLAREAKDLLKEAHNSLVDAIKEVRGISGAKENSKDNNESEDTN